jgi:hypothetical protein
VLESEKQQVMIQLQEAWQRMSAGNKEGGLELINQLLLSGKISF